MRKLLMRAAFMKLSLHYFGVTVHYETEKFRVIKTMADKVLVEDSWSRHGKNEIFSKRFPTDSMKRRRK